MSASNLKPLRTATYDDNYKAFVPLHDVGIADKGAHLVEDPDNKSRYFKFASSRIDRRGSRTQSVPFKVVKLSCSDSLLAQLSDVGIDEYARKKSNKNSLTLEELQAILDSLPKLFKQLLANALRVFRNWTEQGKFDTRSVYSTKSGYYSLKLQAACVVLGHALRDPTFIGLAIKEADYAFVERKDPVTITINDVQLCHAVAPLLNSTLVSLLNRYDETGHKALKALQYSRDVVHPESWKKIKTADDDMTSKAAISKQAKKSTTPVSNKSVDSAVDQASLNGQDSTSHNSDSQDSTAGVEDDAQLDSLSRKSSITDIATTGLDPVELSTSATSPASLAGWQRNGSSRTTDESSSVLRDSQVSDEIVTSPSDLQDSGPSTGTPSNPGLPDWSSDTLPEGTLLEARSSQVPQAPEVRSDQGVFGASGTKLSTDKAKLVTTSEDRTSVLPAVDTLPPDPTTSKNDRLVKQLLTNKKDKTSVNSSKNAALSPKVLGKLSVETKSRPAVLGTVENGGNGQTRSRKAASFKAKQRTPTEYVLEMGDLMKDDFQLPKEQSMFVEQEDVSSEAGDRGMKRVASAGAIFEKPSKSSRKDTTPGIGGARLPPGKATADHASTKKYDGIFLKPHKNMRRKVNTYNEWDKAPESPGLTKIMKPGEAPASHGLTKIVNYGNALKSQGSTKIMRPGEATVLQTPIKNKYADFRKPQKQLTKDDQEMYRKLSAVQQRDKDERAEKGRERRASLG